MRPDQTIDDDQLIEPIGFDFAVSRRGFVQMLGAGVLIFAAAASAPAQQRRGRGEPIPLDARLHIGKDGIITVMTGKVEGGQGARGQITQAAAEELRVDPSKLRLIMADTSLVPDDGITAGSRTTPSTLPAVRSAGAAARELLVQFAAKQKSADPTAIVVRDGQALDAAGQPLARYADLAAAADAAAQLSRPAAGDVAVTAVEHWKVLSTSLPRPNARQLVTGEHQFPSDLAREGMLYGKVLRAPAYGAKLTAVDTSVAKMLENVVVVHDGDFVAVAAPTTYLAKRALRAIETTAKWDKPNHPDSRELFDHLRRSIRSELPPPFADEIASAHKTLRASYNTAYIQHAPMEPRAAMAEWTDGRLTVWTASQNPFGVRRELAGAFRIGEDRVRVIIPDFGGGFGGKHTGETGIEAARIAQAAGKPVAVRWTRQEEFTWAYFRPAAAIDITGTLDSSGAITSWHFVNINSGQAAIEPPYRIASKRAQFVQSSPPLRHGSYRALAAVANNFAREGFMDELAEAAGRDPVEFRLAHLENPRLRAVLDAAADKFDFRARRARPADGGIGVGIACGTEKGSVVATCVEVEVSAADRKIKVRQICQAFECGAITTPDNLLAQVQGCLLMALGPALREEMVFDSGMVRNASLWRYPVPRLTDTPELQIHLLNRPDLPSAGAGETPMIGLAPAIANAVFHATGQRLREIPLKLPSKTG